MLIGYKPYEPQSEQKGYRNVYWKRWITLRDGWLEKDAEDKGYKVGEWHNTSI